MPEGILQLQEGGTFLEEAFNELLKVQARFYLKVHGRVISEEETFKSAEIRKRLDEVTALLHETFPKEREEVRLPGGTCLVGNVYIGEKASPTHLFGFDSGCSERGCWIPQTPVIVVWKA